MTFEALARAAIDEISARSGVALELCSIRRAGSEYFGFRPLGLHDGRGFSIALARTVFRTSAVFVADRFAGEMLRRIGSHTSAELRWPDLVAEGDSRGINTIVTVNASDVADVASMQPSVWQALEIECSQRIPSITTPDWIEDLVCVGEQVLGMVLTGLDLDDEEVLEGQEEGGSRTVVSTRYERSRVNRMRCIREYGTSCWVCDFDFGQTWGGIGFGFVEVHHRVPLAMMPENYRVDPIRDLIPLCSNCHSMIHKRVPVFQPDELRERLGLSPKALPSPTLPLTT